LTLVRLFVNLPQPGDSEVTFSVFVSSCHLLLRSSCQAATCYYQSNHSKVEAIPLSAFQKTQQANMPAYIHTISLMLNVKQGSCEHQRL